MKPSHVIHIPSGNHTMVYILRTVKQLESAIKKSLVHPLIAKAMQSIIEGGEHVAINMKGGYCGMKDVYQKV